MTTGYKFIPPSNNNSGQAFIDTGIIMDNRSPMKNGSVRVWVDGSNYPKEDPMGWKVVDYAPMWYGCTPNLSDNVTFEDNPKSYGLNFPAVDIGTRIAFFTTKSGKSYYFCHLPAQNMQRMIPGLHYEEIDGVNEPVTEYNRNVATDAKAIFIPLSEGLKKQGLDKDLLRGASSASPKRETPSRGFGFLSSRGSQLVLDDGFIEGEIGDNWEKTPQPSPDLPNPANSLEPRQSEMIRLRTRSGAQLLLSETNGHVYLINRDGNCWVELNNSGNFDVWSLNGCSFRTNGTMNFRADKDINFEAGENLNIRSVDGNINVNSGNDMLIKSVSNFACETNGVSFISQDLRASGIIHSTGLVTSSFTVGTPIKPIEVHLPELSQQQDSGEDVLDTIITRLLYKEPCLVHSDVIQSIYTTENDNSLIIPPGSFEETSPAHEVMLEENRAMYTETRKDGVITCKTVTGEVVRFDEKTGTRIS